MEQILNKSQHRKLTLEKKILFPLLLGFELATFQSLVQRFTNKLLRPHIMFEEKELIGLYMFIADVFLCVCILAILYNNFLIFSNFSPHPQEAVPLIFFFFLI